MLLKKKPVDQFHESVDHAGPVHHGPAAMAGLGSLLELGLRPLRAQGHRGRGGGVRGKHGGPDSGLTGAQKAVEQRRNGGESGGREALGADSLRAGREGKEGWGRSGGRRGCQGALL
jgi:hypothetical protein